MPFRTRHQKETVDSVILDASEWKSARESTWLGGNTGLLDRSLSRPVRFCETGVQMSLQVRLGLAIAKLRKIFRDVVHQCRIGGESVDEEDT